MSDTRTKLQEAIEKFQLGRNLGGLALLASVLADIQKQEDLYAAILLDSQVDKQQIADLEAQLVCPTCGGQMCIGEDRYVDGRNGGSKEYPDCDDGTMKSCLEQLRAENERLKENLLLQSEAGGWANDTFGKGQTVTGILNHLIKEVRELCEAKEPLDAKGEAADCVLLLMQHAHETGYDLLEEAKKKHQINLKRKWGKPNEYGVIEHIRDASEALASPQEKSEKEAKNNETHN